MAQHIGVTGLHCLYICIVPAWSIDLDLGGSNIVRGHTGVLMDLREPKVMCWFSVLLAVPHKLLNTWLFHIHSGMDTVVQC